ASRSRSVPRVLRTLPGQHLLTPPAEVGERPVVASFDVSSIERLGVLQAAAEAAETLVVVDHHASYTGFGGIHLVDVKAPATAVLALEMVDRLGVEVGIDIATDVYSGIVTDTGRMSYSNTTAATLRADARLVATGIDVAAIARALYENVDFASLRLTGIALGRASALLDGRLVVSTLTDEDFSAAGTSDADGIAEMLRGVRGAEVGALVRTVSDGVRASLRAAGDAVDVSKIARLEGGGGHRAAAGVSSAKTPDQFVAWLADQVAAQLDG
ncbi:MAG TPA: hypothetical protein PLV41_06195, partial [Miltoncostaeales bacterium]|nr:hypothetical protein [Miltoncostaeales bacterium]